MNENNAIFIGNLNGEKFHDGYAGAVFSINGLSPNITTCQGGGRQPHILIMEKDDDKQE